MERKILSNKQDQNQPMKSNPGEKEGGFKKQAPSDTRESKVGSGGQGGQGQTGNKPQPGQKNPQDRR